MAKTKPKKPATTLDVDDDGKPKNPPPTPPGK